MNEYVKPTIYVADNEEDDNLVKHYMASERYSFVGSSKIGAEVVKDVTLLKPKFLVMELTLSGMDGFMVISELKKNLKDEEMPKIVLISGLIHIGFISKAMKEGISYFMAKPILPANLDARLKDLEHLDESSGQIHGLDEKIANIFISIGIPAHIKGYQFLREAVKLAVEEPDIIGSITKKLYPTIAEKFDTSSSKVERGMRHAIEVAWNRGKIENINRLFGLNVYNSNEKPTNGELIALIADKMLMEG